MDADKMKMQEKLDEADVHDTQLNNSIQDQERQLSKLESKVSHPSPSVTLPLTVVWCSCRLLFPILRTLIFLVLYTGFSLELSFSTSDGVDDSYTFTTYMGSLTSPGIDPR